MFSLLHICRSGCSGNQVNTTYYTIEQLDNLAQRIQRAPAPVKPLTKTDEIRHVAPVIAPMPLARTLALRVSCDATLGRSITRSDYANDRAHVGSIITLCNIHPKKRGVNSWTAYVNQQQKDGHRKTLIAGATAVRRPSGGAFLVGLDARHDRFLLPTRPSVAAQKQATRRPVFLRPGQHASRRAPPDFVGQNKPANVSHWHSCPHAMRDGTAGGSPPSFLGSLRLPEAVRLTQKVGGRAPLRLLAVRGVAPRSSTVAWGRLTPLGRILLGGSPQPQPVPARAGCRLTDSDRVRVLVPLLPAVGCPSRLRACPPNAWRNGSHSTRYACCEPASQVCASCFEMCRRSNA